LNAIVPCRDERTLISDVAYDWFAGTADAEEVHSEMLHTQLCPIWSS
jgi:hypothetical protein